MRRAGPILIIVIGVLALLVDFASSPCRPGRRGRGHHHYLETKLGLDLQGGLRIEYQVLPAEGKTPTRDDLNVLRQIIINRIDKSGVAEPQVVIQGNDRVIVEMPGVQNADQIRNLVGHDRPPRLRPAGPDPADAGAGAAPAVPRARSATPTPWSNCVLFSGDQVAAASIGANQAGQRTVDFTLQPGRARTCSPQYTADHIGDYFAIVLDGKVITRPGDQQLDPQRPGPDQPGQQHRRLPAGRRPEPRDDPPVRPAAVPDPGARQHDRQPDARRGVPAPEPGRRR